MAEDDASSPSRSSGYGMHIAAASAKQVVRGRRWLRALQGAMDSTTQSVGSQGAKIFAKGSEALAMVDQRLGLSEAASAAEQRMQLSEKVAAADRRLQLSAKAQALSQDWQELRGKADTQQGKLMSQLNKAVVRAATSLPSLNSRQLAQALDPKALCFFDAGEFPGCSGLVALTIDDAPCRGETSMLADMKELLNRYDARATFFLCTDSVPGHENALMDLIRAGSEVANHGCSDQPYGGLTESEFADVFRRAENVCETLRAHSRGEEPPSELPELPPSSPTAGESAAPVISRASSQSSASPEPEAAEAESGQGDPTPKRNWPSLGLSGLAKLPQRKAVEAADAPAVVPQSPYRWFRAPHADLSPSMQKVLSHYGFTNVLCDSFANDTQILDSAFIAETLLSLVDPRGGSIIVIHTPEPGFREHNFEALEILLQGLADRQLRAVTVTELTEAAMRTPDIVEVPVSGEKDDETDQH